MKKFNRHFNRRETLLFLEKLALYNESGISLVESLRLSSIGIAKNRAKIILNIQTDIESGGKLSASLVKNIGLARTLSGLIAQGERSGNLGGTLKAAHTILERQDELVKKCLSAMTYPAVIGLCTAGLTLGLVRGVMPQIIPLLTSMNVKLPLLTRITIGFSNGVTSYGIYIVCGLFVVSGLFTYVYRKPYIRYVAHRLLAHIPIVGSLVYSYSIAIFVRSLGMLISSGVPLPSAYTESCKTITFEPLKRIAFPAANNIEKGKALSTVFVGKKIPSHVSSLIVAGESSGTLGETLSRSATIIERDIDYLLKRLTSLIEPLMMVGMGGIVGAIALSIMLPIYDISKMLQHAH